jgi:hypothetical protein
MYRRWYVNGHFRGSIYEEDRPTMILAERSVTRSRSLRLIHPGSDREDITGDFYAELLNNPTRATRG